MNRILMLSLCVVVFAVQEIFSQQVTIMTYNIRYDNPEDGVNKWKFRKEKLCRQVMDKNPDLLGLQEALINQLKDMDSLLTGYERFGVGREDGKEKGEFSAIFYNKSRFIFQDGGNFWLSPDPYKPGSIGWDAACTRMVTWIKLLDLNSQDTVFHFNTHFDHVSVKARIKSARLLKREIKKMTHRKAVIVTGDFNCAADSRPIQMLQQGSHRLSDSRKLTPSIKGPGYSYSTFYTDGKHDEIIDHILVNKSFQVIDYEIVEDSDQGRYYSDHLPIVIHVNLKK